MKLDECKDWKAIHMNGRTILKRDYRYMSTTQKNILNKLEVEPLGKRKGHYRVKNK